MNRREFVLDGLSSVILGSGYYPAVSDRRSGVCYEPLIITTTTGWTFDYMNRQILRAPGSLPKNYDEDTFFALLQKALK